MNWFCAECGCGETYVYTDEYNGHTVETAETKFTRLDGGMLVCYNCWDKKYRIDEDEEK